MVAKNRRRGKKGPLSPKRKAAISRALRGRKCVAFKTVSVRTAKARKGKRCAKWSK